MKNLQSVVTFEAASRLAEQGRDIIEIPYVQLTNKNLSDSATSAVIQFCQDFLAFSISIGEAVSVLKPSAVNMPLVSLTVIEQADGQWEFVGVVKGVTHSIRMSDVLTRQAGSDFAQYDVQRFIGHTVNRLVQMLSTMPVALRVDNWPLMVNDRFSLHSCQDRARLIMTTHLKDLEHERRKIESSEVALLVPLNAKSINSLVTRQRAINAGTPGL